MGSSILMREEVILLRLKEMIRSFYDGPRIGKEGIT